MIHEPGGRGRGVRLVAAAGWVLIVVGVLRQLALLVKEELSTAVTHPVMPEPGAEPDPVFQAPDLVALVCGALGLVMACTPVWWAWLRAPRVRGSVAWSSD